MSIKTGATLGSYFISQEYNLLIFQLVKPDY